MKKIEKYFTKHVYANSLTHLAVGLGLGVLLTHTMFDPHPLRFGVLFLGLGLLGHAYAYQSKK
ncbi:MAG: hypothetical protein A2857_02355 [Candidatus Levybacteria bacterium RIFCSPHIGHO2_01_FULL_36_15]|nr:MAG: hypothetical protein A2857_02355 [Candidatus Levybacteria bacterium RIFCSPHIGHO2_01_FULL_36_15]OGH39243.1 MAG: hypothetical protein A2905_01705 [Candidatus Levybacteria bacterium RIFCSPLOWO2_01_FULL_36_10]